MFIEERFVQSPRSSFESRLSRSEDSDLSEPALGPDKSGFINLSESRFIGDLSGRSAMCIEML